MPARGTLFLNRRSGARLAPSELDGLASAAADAGLEVLDVGDDVDMVREIRERAGRGVRLFVAAGGDGTVHHVVQALVNTDAVFAVIPTGTYNHFARDLGIPLDWRLALEVALTGKLRQIDVGRVNDRFFVNNVSLGLYPEMVARREEGRRIGPRWKARLRAVLITMRKYRHVTLAVETPGLRELIQTHVFIVSNNSYDLEQMGIEAFRPAMTEGRLSVYWLPHTSRLRLMNFVARYMTGHVRRTPGFRSHRTVSLRVQCSRPGLEVGVDGEVFTLATPLVVTIVPQSVVVRVPGRQLQR